MSETTIYLEGRTVWLPKDIANDIKKQAGIDVVLFFCSKHAYGCSGKFNNISFDVSWVYEKFLVLSMETFSQELVDAFSKVYESKPVFYYTRNLRHIAEWSQEETDEIEFRFKQLREFAVVSNLVRIFL